MNKKNWKYLEKEKEKKIKSWIDIKMILKEEKKRIK